MLSGRRDDRASDVESSVSVCAGNKMEKMALQLFKGAVYPTKSTVEELFPPHPGAPICYRTVTFFPYTPPHITAVTGGRWKRRYFTRLLRHEVILWSLFTKHRRVRTQESSQISTTLFLPGFSKQSSWIGKKKMLYSPSKPPAFFSNAWAVCVSAIKADTTTVTHVSTVRLTSLLQKTQRPAYRGTQGSLIN